MSKSTSGENFFIDPDIKKKVIEHLIKGISAAKVKNGTIVTTETKEDLGLWQTNLGQYLGYLTNNPNVNRPDLFNMLFSIYKKQNPKLDPSKISSMFEYNRQFCSDPERLAKLYGLSDEDKNKLNKLNHFLSKDDIKEILKKTGCSQEDLESKEFFKLFLGSLEEAEKKFIYDSVAKGISDSDAGFFLKKEPLNQKDIVTLGAYGLSETSNSPAIQKPSSSTSALFQAKKSENTLKITKQIQTGKTEPISNPQEFCAPIISSTNNPIAEKIANNLGETLPQPKIKESLFKQSASISGDKIELKFVKIKDKKLVKVSQVIDPKANNFIELDEIKGEVKINKENFRKELMDYYKGENKYKSPDTKIDEKIDKSALEVLNLYRTSPNSSFQPKDSIQTFKVTKQKKPPIK